MSAGVVWTPELLEGIRRRDARRDAERARLQVWVEVAASRLATLGQDELARTAGFVGMHAHTSGAVTWLRRVERLADRLERDPAEVREVLATILADDAAARGNAPVGVYPDELGRAYHLATLLAGAR